MTPELWIAIAAIAVPACASVIVSLINTRKLTNIHTIINSRLSELVAASMRAERAEGVVQGSSDTAQLTKMVKAAVADALKGVPVVAEVPVVVTPMPPKE